MAKISPGVKKVIKTETKKSESVSGPSSNINIRKKTVSNRTNTPTEFTFNKDNLKWMMISVGLVILGYLLMMGGKMPSKDVWDESIIYSFRRTVLAPIVILGGIGLSIYSIFRHKSEQTIEA